MTDENGETHQPAKRWRWKLGAGMAVVGAIIATLLWFLSPDGTRAVLTWFVAVPATALLVLLWWVFFSRLRWRIRLIGVVLVATAAGLFVLTFRFKGFEGDMLPQWTFRWEPTPEARAERFWRDQNPATTVSAGGLVIMEDDWPQFRGPQRDGVVRAGNIRDDWNAHPPREVWRHSVGPGWSSFAIVGRFAFTQEQRREMEAVVCYDARTGDQIWVHSNRVRFSEAMGGDGPRATPTVFDSRLYALGATGILDCLDARTGTLIWSRNILKDADAENPSWAMSGSPLVYDDVVIVNPGGGKGKAVAAYDRLTGEKVWAAGNRTAGYAAPRLETIGGVRQLLIFGGDGLAGHDAEDGRELWFRPWTNQPKVNAAQPIVHDGNLVFFSSGYSTGGMLLEVKQTAGTTDRQRRTNGQGRWSAVDRWDKPNLNLKLKFNDAVFKDGFLYGLDEGILVCLDYLSGERKWKRGRYGYGQLLLIDDTMNRQRRAKRPCRLLVQAESGEVALVEATPDAFREISRFQAIEGKTWNHPAIAGGMLFVRNAEEAACYDLRPTAATTSAE